ncbi:hypothetical protein [Saccharomonospora sp. CUA-673]|uniref:hypothetical protein n=1 Tax=Saccharomonospora sp. CUA-673 TaxID=1904969 RepID=UPI0011153B31|nr:hypothetical protein [Saccharomonospora sp. CUA-673]
MTFTPRATPEDREAVKVHHETKTKKPEDKLQTWRRKNPDFFRTWETKTGCVIAFGGMKVFYGRCPDCGALVTTRRRMKHGGFKEGRWPVYCRPCGQLRQKRTPAQETERKRRYRRKKRQEQLEWLEANVNRKRRAKGEEPVTWAEWQRKVNGE